MIVEFLINAICSLIIGVFSILPDLPHFEGLENSLHKVFDLIFNNLQLLDIFIRPSTIKLIIPVLIVILNFEHIWDFTMFIIRKLPISVE